MLKLCLTLYFVHFKGVSDHFTTLRSKGLNFNKPQSIYAYKHYAYKKLWECMECIIPIFRIIPKQVSGILLNTNFNSRPKKTNVLYTIKRRKRKTRLFIMIQI